MTLGAVQGLVLNRDTRSIQLMPRLIDRNVATYARVLSAPVAATFAVAPEPEVRVSEYSSFG